jgi:hypothetical protein
LSSESAVVSLAFWRKMTLSKIQKKTLAVLARPRSASRGLAQLMERFAWRKSSHWPRPASLRPVLMVPEARLRLAAHSFFGSVSARFSERSLVAYCRA